MSNQIETYSKLNDLPAIQALGQAIAGSGMFGCNKEEQGLVLALQCVAENKPPLELAKNYHIIQGKLTKRADAMLADFRKAGGKFIFEDLKNPTIQKAKVTFEDYKELEVSYSIDDAKTCNVHTLKDKNGNPSMWAKYPSVMLRARLVSETLRAIAPEIVVGVYTPEEASQFNEPVETVKKSTPAKKESKPSPKPVEAEVIEPEIVDDPINDEPKDSLSALISDNDAEEIINDYFVNKGKIEGKNQTWRNLPEEVKASMEIDFFNLLAAARKVQG